MESLKNTSNDNLRKVVREFLHLSLNMKIVLDLYYKFFLSPNDFIAFDENVNQLSDACARIDIHNENIEALIKQLKNKNEI